MSWLVAAIAAALGALVAPTSWPDGVATLQLTIDGVEQRVGEIEIGSDQPLEWVAAGGLRVTVPEGAKRDGPLSVIVSGEGLSLDRVGVTVELADGSREVIPVVRSELGEVLASRRQPRGAGIVLGLLAGVAVLWVAGVVPLHVPSLLVPVVLAVGGVGSATEVLAPFFHPIVVLFFAGFLLAIAMQRSGLDTLVAAAIVSRARGGPRVLHAVLVSLAAVLSMFMSNTAAVAVLIPIALAISAPLKSATYVRALVLGIAYAAAVGGVGSAIGTPANPLAIEFLREGAGRSLTFLDWFAFGLPMVVVMVPLIAVWVWQRAKVVVDPQDFLRARQIALQQRVQMGRMDRHQRVVAGMFVAIVLGWVTQAWHGVDTGIVALAGVIVLFVAGRLRTEDLSEISWTSLLTFGGGLSLGLHLTSSGAADWIATRLVGLEAVPETVGLLVVAGVTLALTSLASNTATAAMMVPLAIPLAGILGVDPVILVLVVALASSVDFAFVIGTPPTMLAYSTGLFTTREIFGRGIVLDFLGILVLVFLVVPFWRLVGLV